jgi:hypothetical protein
MVLVVMRIGTACSTVALLSGKLSRPIAAQAIRRISAVRFVVRGDGQVVQKGVTQLESASRLLVCGEGFDHRTVRVKFDDQNYYVFRQDIQII